VRDPSKEHGCKHGSQTFYIQHILGAIKIKAMIKENDDYKVVFYFLSPNVLLLFILKIAL
jgi:Ca2+/Na+ antiporter